MSEEEFDYYNSQKVALIFNFFYKKVNFEKEKKKKKKKKRKIQRN